MMKSPTLQFNMLNISSYSDDEDEDDQSMTCGTMSSVASDAHMDQAAMACDVMSVRSASSLTMSFFQHALENELETNQSRNTYFMDGGNRFISVPNLGYHTKPSASIARLFEDWLAEKLYCQPTSEAAEQQRLPILQDSVELVAEDILNKIKSNQMWRKGIDKVLIKVRAGHVYTYHSLEGGQPLITQEMEELFQQFPLFVEMHVHATLREGAPSTQCMLSIENVTVNPHQPYKIMEEF